MVKKQKPNWLCRLGLHKWRDFGEKVMIVWKEPAVVKTPYEKFTQKSRKVFTKKKCLRCGIGMKRRLIENPDGTSSCIGWKPLLDSEYENDRFETR
jgi:hypothetical protein